MTALRCAVCRVLDGTLLDAEPLGMDVVAELTDPAPLVAIVRSEPQDRGRTRARGGIRR